MMDNRPDETHVACVACLGKIMKDGALVVGFMVSGVWCMVYGFMV